MAAGIAATAHGQTVLPVHMECSDADYSKNGIIREQNLTYYEVNGAGRFAHIYLTNPGHVFEATVPTGWHVRDFRVLNDTVYFCGIDSNEKSALIGYFPANTLLADNGVVQYHRDTCVEKLSILNRMAVAQDKNSGKVSLIAIGTSTPGIDPERLGANRVVYYSDIHNSMAKCVFFSDIDKEPQLCWDVVASDTYYTIVATDTFNTDKLALRWVKNSTNPSNFMIMINSYRQYTCEHNFSSGIRATHLDADTIALASYCDMSPDLGLQVFTIDMITGVMAVNQSNSIGDMPTGRPLPPFDMAYQPSTRSLMLLDTTFVSGSCALRIDPYLNNWMDVPPYFFRYDHRPRYTSIVAVSPDAFMMVGGKKWLLLKPGLLPPPERYNNCIGSFTYDIFKQTCYIFTEYSSGKSLITDVHFNTSSSYIVSVDVERSCTPSVFQNDEDYPVIPYPVPTK